MVNQKVIITTNCNIFLLGFLIESESVLGTVKQNLRLQDVEGLANRIMLMFAHGAQMGTRSFLGQNCIKMSINSPLYPNYLGVSYKMNIDSTKSILQVTNISAILYKLSIKGFISIMNQVREKISFEILTTTRKISSPPQKKPPSLDYKSQYVSCHA